MKIPPGAQPGHTIRLRGLGLPRLRGRRRGDQHVVVEVVIPGKLDREQRKLAERLDESLRRKGDPAGR